MKSSFLLLGAFGYIEKKNTEKERAESICIHDLVGAPEVVVSVRASGGRVERGRGTTALLSRTQRIGKGQRRERARFSPSFLSPWYTRHTQTMYSLSDRASALAV